MAEERAYRKKPKKKVCAFCADKVAEIDYKDVAKLRKYIKKIGSNAPYFFTLYPTCLPDYESESRTSQALYLPIPHS